MEYQARIEVPQVAQRFGDGFEYLKAEHRIIMNLMERIDKTPDAMMKKPLVDELITRVSIHASIEEQHVYGLFNRLPHGDQYYQRNVRDDDANKIYLELLRVKIDPATEPLLYNQTASKFNIIERDHLTSEEQWFDMLRGYLQPHELRELEETLRRAETTAPTKPHPYAPSTELGAKLTHPIAGLIDKAQEALTGRK